MREIRQAFFLLFFLFEEMKARVQNQKERKSGIYLLISCTNDVFSFFHLIKADHPEAVYLAAMIGEAWQDKTGHTRGPRGACGSGGGGTVRLKRGMDGLHGARWSPTASYLHATLSG